MSDRMLSYVIILVVIAFVAATTILGHGHLLGIASFLDTLLPVLAVGVMFKYLLTSKLP
jgi:hypothetical protein